MKAEEIYQYHLPKGTIHFPDTKQAIITAMKEYARFKCEEQRNLCIAKYFHHCDLSEADFYNITEPKFD